jgi:AraC-like DNA-binding protein
MATRYAGGQKPESPAASLLKAAGGDPTVSLKKELVPRTPLPLGSDFSPESLTATNPLPRDVVHAITHMRANLHRNVPTPELAAVTGVGERTLREHFQLFLGVSPNAYSTRLRLTAARRALQQPAELGSITRVATQYGFSHLGRFVGCSVKPRRTHGGQGLPPCLMTRHSRLRCCAVTSR